MGRIKDKVQYPIKGSPDNNDYVVGTDSDAGGATVSFRLGDLFIQSGTEGLLPKGGFDGTAVDIINLIPTATAQLTNNGSFGGFPYVEQDGLDLLQAQVAALQAIILGEGVNLELIDELVIAIQNIQTYLDTILVNDLVTGGTTKALTAEQGVVLNGLITSINSELNNKVDKVVGERLINASEIEKVANLSGVNTGDQDLSSYQALNQKGQANGYVPLNNLIKIPSEYLTIVNNLTAGGASSILSAEQGRQIKILIDNINSLLSSDNVNLNTLQELVDAIEQLQSSLSQLIVNDLVTGGTTKALSAEQGVVLKGLISQLGVDIQTALSFKENAFLKNTAFNKNFGTTAGTVAEGSHISDTNNPHSVTKGQVGLGNVDNTSDIDKPVSTATQVELDLKLDKSSIVDPNIITKIGLISQAGSVITIAALAFEWRINQVNYTNTLQYSTTISNATDNYSRIDLIVANTSGSFTKIEGVEDIELAVKPNIPQDTLEVAFINVYGSVVSTAQPVTTGSEFVAKKEFEFRKVNGNGNKASVNITDESASFRFPTADGISSISVNNNSLKYIYSGKKHYIKNDKVSGTFTIFNNAGTGNYKYFFPNGLDLTLQAGEIAEFMFRLGSNNTGFLDYIGVTAPTVDISGKVDKVVGERLINEAEIVKLSNTSGTNTGDQDLSGKEDTTNKSQTIETDKASTAKYGSVKAFYDWAVAKFQLALVSGTNIRTVNGQSLLGSTDLFIAAGSSTDVISYALSAPTGNLTVGDVDTFHAPYNFTLSSYWIGVKTPPTISSLLVDVKKNAVSITSTKAGIDATEFTSLTGTAPVLTTTTFIKGDVITPVISQIGSGDTGISLKIYLEVIKT